MPFLKWLLPTLLLASLLQTINAQTVETLNVKNFFGLKYDADLVDANDYERLIIDNKLIYFRRYYPESRILAEEYLPFQNDTFIYIEHPLTEQRIAAKGKVVASICCNPVDTSFTFDPETYEEKTVLIQYWNWSKEGYWKFDAADSTESGRYKNNFRVGEWFVWNKTRYAGKYIYYDSLGRTVYEEPQNLIETNNSQRIRKELTGLWLINELRKNVLHLTKRRHKEDDKIERSDVGDFGSLLFSTDSVTTYPYIRCGNGFNSEAFSKKRKGGWSLDEMNTLMMNIFGFEGNRYQISYISRNEMYLRLVL